MMEATESLHKLTDSALAKCFSLELANYSSGSMFMLVVSDDEHTAKALNMMIHKLHIRGALFVSSDTDNNIVIFDEDQKHVATYLVVANDRLETSSKGTTIHDVLVLDELLPLDKDIVNSLMPCIDSDSLEHSRFAKVVKEHDEQHNSET